MTSHFFQDRDAVARFMGKNRKDILWSYEEGPMIFRCDIVPGEDMVELPAVHDPTDERILLAAETGTFCLGLTARDRNKKEPLIAEISVSCRGTIVSAEITAVGTEGGYTGVTRDITRQKRIENALRKSEATYRTLLKTSPDAVIVIDREGDIIKSNNHAAATLRESREDLIGRSIMDFIHTAKGTAPPVLSDIFKSSGTVESKEFEMKRADGTVFTGEMSVSSLNQAETGQNAYIAVVRDVTKKKRAERELVKSGERYRSLIETMNEGLVIIDKNLLFTYVNRSASQVLGYSFEEILGKPLETVMDKKNSDLLKRKLSQARKNDNREYRFEITARRRTGETAHLVLSPKSIFGRDGGYLGAFAVLTDITAIKQAEQERNRLADEIITMLTNRLSEREKVLLMYLSQGYRWPAQKRELCKKMNVLPGTLDKFLARIKRKMEIDDLNTLIAIAGAKLR